MNNYLMLRLKLAYPTGFEHEPDESVYESEERDNRLRNALSMISRTQRLRFIIDRFDKPAYNIAITQTDHPEFGTWVTQMCNAERLAWIKNADAPYSVFHLKISRLANYYYYYYNHWVPSDDTGYLDIDFKRKPSESWSIYEKVILNAFEEHGFAYLSNDIALEDVPFILEHDYDSITDDDPRWDDEEFVPPLVPCSVHKLLFGV